MTDEIMKKIDSSQKVAKKLERFAKKQNGQSKDDEYGESREDENGQSKEDENDQSKDEMTESDSDQTDGHEADSLPSGPSDFSSLVTGNEQPVPEMNFKQLLQRMEEIDQKIMYNSDGCLCNCHKPPVTENTTQTAKYCLNGYTNGTSSCSTASIQTQTSTETIETNNNSLDDAVYEKPTNGYTNGDSHRIVDKCDFSTQTLSTGDIVITKVYFNESVAN